MIWVGKTFSEGTFFENDNLRNADTKIKGYLLTLTLKYFQSVNIVPVPNLINSPSVFLEQFSFVYFPHIQAKEGKLLFSKKFERTV